MPYDETILANSLLSLHQFIINSNQKEEEEEEEEEEEDAAVKEVVQQVSEKMNEIDFKKMEAFFFTQLRAIHKAYSSQDASRMTLLYFILGGLDVIRSLENVLLGKDRQDVIDWIYAMQVLPSLTSPSLFVANGGFRGGSYYGRSFHHPHLTDDVGSNYDSAHLAMTYTALACLKLLGDDDFKHVDKRNILRALTVLQMEDGSFTPVAASEEHDMRFVYCAAAISYFLNDFSAIDVDRAVDYIVKSQNSDGGIGQGPNLESHGGSTYCAIAALICFGRLGDLKNKDRLIRWCLTRQCGGFQGRPNKDPDVCYTFWIGATLDMLGVVDLIEGDSTEEFVISCQSLRGGFSKCPDANPDLLHAYFGLAGLSLLKRDPYRLKPIHSHLGIAKDHHHI